MFDDLIAQMSALWRVPFTWIKAVMLRESSGIPTRYNPNDPSYGLMGIVPSTARDLGYTGTVEGLFDPETSLYLGAKYLAQLRDRYGDDLRRVYSAYNSGRPDLYLTSSQVRTNVDAVLAFAASIAAETGEIISEQPAAAGAGVVLVGLLALLLLRKKGR